MWSGRVFLIIDRARSDAHRHGAMQLTLGLTAPVRVGKPDEEGLEGGAILVAANQPHWFESEGDTVVVWMEPDSRLCRALSEAYLQKDSLAVLDEERFAPLREQFQVMREGMVSEAQAQALWRGIETTWLEAFAPAPPLSPVLKRALKVIDSVDLEQVPAAELADKVGVSESHLMHSFKEGLGMPLRRYQVWRRVCRAMRAISKGATAAQAAHQCGFHDPSHLSRVFRQLLDIRPGELTKILPHSDVRYFEDR